MGVRFLGRWGVPMTDASNDGAGDGADPHALVARLRAAGSVFAEAEAEMLLVAATAGRKDLEALVRRRVRGEPLAHVVGFADFAGHRIRVGTSVFVPRPRTEHLVDVAIELGRERAVGARPVVVVDLCCGTGAVGLAVAAALRRNGRVRLVAADLDPDAVACASSNLRHVDDEVVEGDLVAALPTDLVGRIDLLVANVPYVPTADLRFLPSDVRGHERRLAHDGGKDGLDVLRRVARVACRWLAPDGVALFEVAGDQVEAATAACAAGGLGARPVVHEGDDEEATVLVAGPDPGPVGRSADVDTVS